MTAGGVSGGWGRQWRLGASVTAGASVAVGGVSDGWGRLGRLGASGTARDGWGRP